MSSLFAIVMRRFLIAFGPRALVVAPLVWVATELGRTYLFTGFPWVLLGYSQATVLPIAQLASVLGVFGVSGARGLRQRRRDGEWRSRRANAPAAAAVAAARRRRGAVGRRTRRVTPR